MITSKNENFKPRIPFHWYKLEHSSELCGIALVLTPILSYMGYKLCHGWCISMFCIQYVCRYAVFEHVYVSYVCIIWYADIDKHIVFFTERFYIHMYIYVCIYNMYVYVCIYNMYVYFVWCKTISYTISSYTSCWYEEEQYLECFLHPTHIFI